MSYLTSYKKLSILPALSRILALCLLGPGIVSAWQDPLSGSEEAAAVSLALSDKPGNAVESADKASPTLNARQAIQSSEQPLLLDNAAAAGAAAANNKTPITLGKEVLLVELLYQKQKKNVAQTKQQRIAEVFLFDYETGKTSRYEIDLNTDDVLREQAVASPHLPLNDREQSVAVSLLENDDAAFANLSAEYQKYFGEALQDAANIDMKVFVWQPPAGNTSAAANDCRTQRCAMISLFTRDNFSFSMEPVVNLMTQSVHTGVIR